MQSMGKMTTFETTKHPLIVLAVATLLGSVLFPLANAYISKASRLDELRTSHALQALRSSHATDSRLNLLITEFQNFAKDEDVTDPRAIAALSQRVKPLYADFNREAWWWYWQLLQESRLLRLVDSAEEKPMRLAMDEYSSNLKECTVVGAGIWRILTTTSVRPSKDEASAALAAADKRMAELQQQRSEIIARMIQPLLN
jgi:hypothetical protein